MGLDHIPVARTAAAGADIEEYASSGAVLPSDADPIVDEEAEPVVRKTGAGVSMDGGAARKEECASSELRDC